MGVGGSRSTAIWIWMAGLWLAGAAQGAEQYDFDSEQTSITFSAKHFMFVPIRGSFKEFLGTIFLDEEDPARSSVELTILASSIDTRNRRRDRHLRGEDFFDTENYPDISFRSQKIERQGKGWLATGTLSMRGIVKQIRLPFELEGPESDGDGKRLRIRGAMSLNRKEYGISWNGLLDRGGVVVSNNVKIQLDVQAVWRLQPAAPVAGSVIE